MTEEGLPAAAGKRRVTVTKKQMRDIPPGADCFVPGTPEERVALVWPLTAEAVSLSGKYDAEQRLQRHVTRLIRRNG